MQTKYYQKIFGGELLMDTILKQCNSQEQESKSRWWPHISLTGFVRFIFSHYACYKEMLCINVTVLWLTPGSGFWRWDFGGGETA